MDDYKQEDLAEDLMRSGYSQREVADELNINQYNSIDNLIKKLKSMLSVGKHF